MKTIIKLSFLALIALLTFSCSIYNFTGTGKIDAESFQVNFFQNKAELIEPNIDRKFTIDLQDFIQNRTNLSLTNSGGDLIYEGEIVEYRVTPMTATSDQRAAQNRLTIAVNVRFTNTKNEEDDFEKRFSFYHDYDGNAQLVGATLTTAIEDIYPRIIQEVFNESLAKW